MGRVVAVASIVLALFSSVCLARDTTHFFPIEEAMTSSDAKAKLNAGITFHFASSPSGAKVITSAVANRKTNAFGKSDEKACKWVFLSAMIALQDRAVKEGADAVTNIVSYYKKNERSSETEYECHAGAIMAGVALKGDIVKLKK
ncbi:excinuclease ATPase subunit [Pseudoteredinibacter isoporae]|uniref:excinuclease ATPase subunit n=1 Tax=Pseudoteredinibacter isoporae TaxID=570281 RepID=UPI003108FABB